MSDPKGPKILVADDDPELLAIICETLTERGAEVKPVSDGEAAFNEALLNSYDLFMLDVEMPKLDGLKTCKQLRTSAFTRNTPVLIVTGKTDLDTIKRARAAGAWDFLPKPINAIVLWQRIQNLLEFKRTRDTSRSISESMEVVLGDEILKPGSGETKIRPSGATAIRPSGETKIRPSGVTTIRPSGETHIRPSGETHIRPPGDSTPPGSSDTNTSGS